MGTIWITLLNPTLNAEKNKFTFDAVHILEKWTKFTYFGEDIRILTKILKNTKLNVSYTARKAIRNNCKQVEAMISTITMAQRLKCLSCDHIYIYIYMQVNQEETLKLALDSIMTVRRHALHILDRRREYGWTYRWYDGYSKTKRQ
jgi:hypothetical protein